MKSKLFDFFGLEPSSSPMLHYEPPPIIKSAVHKCIIPSTWVEGQAVPGFEVPKDCMKAKANLHDVRLNPMNCELQALFLIQLVFGKEGCKFEGWC